MRSMWRLAVLLGGVAGCVCAVAAFHSAEAAMEGLQLSSPAFAQGKPIPAEYAKDGRNVSPPLKVDGVPAGAKSLALIVDDPDAPMGTWVHWVVWNLPPDAGPIPAGSLPEGAVEGRNSWKRNEYGGPAPPSGTHRYFFRLFALDTTLKLAPSAGARELRHAIEGHVLGTAELVGTYSKR
jgi:Raf kinase inhibitor-like YbhB/YbcL family protein